MAQAPPPEAGPEPEPGQPLVFSHCGSIVEGTQHKGRRRPSSQPQARRVGAADLGAAIPSSSPDRDDPDRPPWPFIDFVRRVS